MEQKRRPHNLFANNFALGEKGDGDDGILLR
jgi:hypothetical protein